MSRGFTVLSTLSPTILKPTQSLGCSEDDSTSTSPSKIVCRTSSPPFVTPELESSRRAETSVIGELLRGEKQGASTLSSLQVETTQSELSPTDFKGVEVMGPRWSELC